MSNRYNTLLDEDALSNDHTEVAMEYHTIFGRMKKPVSGTPVWCLVA